MSIVGKKRVKPEVVLLLPRFSIHANIFWLWKLTSSLMVEKITFWHICMFFIFSFHVKHVWACLRFCISYWIFFTYRSFSFHIPSVLYFHICWIFRGKLAESGELQVKMKTIVMTMMLLTIKSWLRLLDRWWSWWKSYIAMIMMPLTIKLWLWNWWWWTWWYDVVCWRWSLLSLLFVFLMW